MQISRLTVVQVSQSHGVLSTSYRPPLSMIDDVSVRTSNKSNLGPTLHHLA